MRSEIGLGATALAILYGVVGCSAAAAAVTNRHAYVSAGATWSRYKSNGWAAYAVVVTTPAGRRVTQVTFALAGTSDRGATLTETVGVPGQSASSAEVVALAEDPRAPRWTPLPGTEDVTVGGHTFHCTVYTGHEPNDPWAAGGGGRDPVIVIRADRNALAGSKVWVSDEVPGGIVKLHSELPSADGASRSTTDMTLTACHAG